MLYIDNMKDKIDLGIEPVGATKPVNVIAVDEKSVAEIWDTMGIDEFKKTVSRLTRTQIDNIVSYAVETKNINLDKVNFIKEITADRTGKNGRDILKILEHKRQIEEGKKLAEKLYDDVN
jgi:MFS superfamily sulfate permease-like transporter